MCLDLTTFPFIFTDPLSLKEFEFELSVKTVSSLINSLVSQILVQEEIFTSSSKVFSFERQASSHLTGKIGFYLVINKKNRKYYFGETTNLAQRKGEYNLALTNAANGTIGSSSNRKISKAILDEFKSIDGKNQYRKEDFIYIPLFSINETSLIFPDSLDQKNQKELCVCFWKKSKLLF